MEKFDVVIIGGGLLGCFAARELARYRLSIAVLEKREDVCTGISKANTAIVYPGCDTKPGTLKTAMCVRANGGFDRLCGELGVRYSRCGSLMVSFGERGDKVLRDKLEQGKINGVPDLKLLSGAETSELEPVLAAGVSSALYCPGTGTVNPWELGIAAFENARANGVDFRFNAEVTALRRENGLYAIQTERGEIFARAIINCAGLFSDEVRELLSRPSVRIYPERADYLVLDDKTKGLLRHIIFHEPERKGKGLTLVPTVEGNILVGPSEQPGGDKKSFSTTREGLEFLYSLCEKVAPALPMDSVIRSFGAIRPNPFYVSPLPDGGYEREQRSISNFTILTDEENPAVVSLIGIKTPGLTCACELGRHVAAMITQALGTAEKNPDFDPVRPAPVRLKEMSPSERAEFVKQNSEYGRIVCRCRGISEGEITDAVRRGAVTLDGVKRRVGATSGRCQGSFCMQRDLEIISRETGLPPEKICKDGAGTEILGCGK